MKRTFDQTLMKKDLSKYHTKEEGLPRRVRWNEDVFSSINGKKVRDKKRLIQNLINNWSFKGRGNLKNREFLEFGTYDHENKENI